MCKDSVDRLVVERWMASVGWRALDAGVLLIAGTYSGPEGLISLSLSLSASASSFGESSKTVPPEGRGGYQLMACPREEIGPTKLHPVLDGQRCSKSNSPPSRGDGLIRHISKSGSRSMYECRQGGLLGRLCVCVCVLRGG